MHCFTVLGTFQEEGAIANPVLKISDTPSSAYLHAHTNTF